MKMEKTEVRAVIKFYVLKGKSATQIQTKLNSVLGDSSPSFSTIHSWVAEFKRGRTSCNDAPRSGRPNEVTTPEMVTKIKNIVLQDRRLKLREIAHIVNISSERVFNILHEYLSMKKLCARWVPRLLNDEQKKQRVNVSKECLELFRRNPNEFLRRFITVDETWIHHYTPETKEQSKQWTKSGEPAPKKAKMTLSAGKVMATVFWDARGVIYVDYLEKGKTITGTYYANLLQKLSDVVKQERPHLNRKKILFHHDNAPVHTAKVAIAKIQELRLELLPHPPYSPDLAPCDFHLFPNLKKWLGGQKFSSNTEVVDAVNGYFQGLDKNFYKNGMMALEKRWSKCIELGGTYVEK